MKPVPKAFNLPEEHERFIHRATRLFPGAVVVDVNSFDQARDRVFAMLREANKHKDPVSRWISACRVFHDLHKGNEDPHRTWAARVLDEDLTAMLAALHKAGHATDYTSPWPDQWP